VFFSLEAQLHQLKNADELEVRGPLFHVEAKLCAPAYRLGSSESSARRPRSERDDALLTEPNAAWRLVRFRVPLEEELRCVASHESLSKQRANGGAV